MAQKNVSTLVPILIIEIVVPLIKFNKQANAERKTDSLKVRQQKTREPVRFIVTVRVNIGYNTSSRIFSPETPTSQS